MHRTLPLLLAFTLVPALTHADDRPVTGPIRASLTRSDFSLNAPPVRAAVPAVMRPTRRQAGALAGAVGGAIAAGYGGLLLERIMTPRCSGDMCGLRGAMIGVPVGAVVGGIIGARAAGR